MPVANPSGFYFKKEEEFNYKLDQKIDVNRDFPYFYKSS